MTVVSKNTYEILGNDPELDPDRAPKPPTKIADNPAARFGKRNAANEDAKAGRGAIPGAGEQKDMTARPRQQDDGLHRARTNDQGRGSGTRQRSSRGGNREGRGAGRAPRDDRHNKSGISEHEKQAARGWGANTGEGEFEDEREGLNDARKEENAEGIVATDTTPVNEDGTPVDQLPTEPEDKTKSYEQYLAEQVEKRAALNDRPLPPRQANEGSTTMFPEGKLVDKSVANDALIKGAEKAANNKRERKARNTLEIGHAWVEQESSSGRGDGEGRRGGRGGRGGFRGEGRGDRAAGEGRGEQHGGRGGRGEGRGGRGSGRGGPRGELRGGEGRGGFRGEGRGGHRGGRAPNVTDSQAFPTLGS